MSEIIFLIKIVETRNGLSSWIQLIDETPLHGMKENVKLVMDSTLYSSHQIKQNSI